MILRSTLLLLALMAAPTAGQDLTIGQVTEKIGQRYEMIDNAVAQFTQHVKFGFSSIEQTFSGTLTMKKPNKFRVESEHQTLVTDGSSVWAYSPTHKQVVIDRYRENQNSISPDQFLLNLPSSYYATILGTEPGGQNKQMTIKLVPKDDRSFVKSVKLLVEQGTWVVRKIVVLDVNETETTYGIEHLALNTALKDTLFSFTPPPGTEVVDLR